MTEDSLPEVLICFAHWVGSEGIQWRLTVVVVSFVECHVEGFNADLMEVTVKIEGSADNETGHDKRERDIAVLPIIVGGGRFARKPEVVVLAGGGKQLLLNWSAIGGVSKDLQGIQAAPQSCMAIKPLMMDST